ncbi:MAG: DNA-3-methyladenine glycosylase [Granulosicoccus sp.]
MSIIVDKPLDRITLLTAVKELGERDAMLRRLATQFGAPPLWRRSQSFETLVHIVLEQKVSLTSAQAVMRRVQALCPSMSAEQFVTVPEAKLRKAGISGRKVSYCYSMAESLTSGQLDLTSLRKLPDEQVVEKLMMVRGIGPWTAGVYLLMAMRRPDAWASGDRALVVSLAESAGLETVPDYSGFDEYAMRWQPHRGTAARLLWHAYLQRRKQKSG